MTKPASPPPKPKLTAEERRAKTTARLWATRLRVTVDRELENRGITDPKAIGEAIGLPALEATKLLTRLQWRQGDVALSRPQPTGWGCRRRSWTRGSHEPVS